MLSLGVALFGTSASKASGGDSQPCCDWRTGDLVFQTSQSRQVPAISAATGSPLTHVGMVRVYGGKTFVVEAISTVSLTPLDDWIKRGKDGKFAVYRVPTLTPENAEKVWKKAKSYMGRPYDIHFHSDEERIYCTELVALAFKAAGIDLDTHETYGKDLDMDRKEVKSLLQKRWGEHPACKGKAKSMNECIKLLREQPVITPAGMAGLKLLDKEYSNY